MACGRIPSVFICGSVCTQLSHRANWQSWRQDGDLFNEARGVKERETEGPDYKQTKHHCAFRATMWRTFILIKSQRQRLRTCCRRRRRLMFPWREGREGEDTFLNKDQRGVDPDDIESSWLGR